MIKKDIRIILGEINYVLSKIDEDVIDIFIQEIIKAKNIVSVGAGRVGLATKGFSMRLGQLGLSAYMVGDSTVPAVSGGDVLVVSSGSGETQTIYDIVEIAKKNKTKILLITGNPESRIGRLADVIIKIEAPSKTKTIKGFESIQPMTTLNEQCLGIFFDAVVLRMMKKLNETGELMWSRHSNLE